MKVRKTVSEIEKTGKICIDKYDDNILAGRLWYPSFDKVKKFNNFMQLLILIEQQLDEMGFPEAYDDKLSFSKSTLSRLKDYEIDQDDLSTKMGEITTFSVKILFRQNGSWQGILNHGNKHDSFKSVLEFIKIFDSVLAERFSV